MFNHILVGAHDVEKSRQFYDAFLGALGAEPGVANKGRYFWRHQGNTFGVTLPINGEPATFANGGTIGFVADSPEAAKAAHDAGVAAGGTSCENPPGWRGEGAMYLAYVRDPAGNKLCVVHRPSAA